MVHNYHWTVINVDKYNEMHKKWGNWYKYVYVG